jgi:phage host-nuclease inhibitor protein Gam
MTMNHKCLALLAVLTIGLACQPQRTVETERPAARAADEARAAADAMREEAEQARQTLSKRLDDLDRELDKLDERAERASAKTRAKLKAQAREMRADARKLRDRMSTWDDKAESGWRSAKREVEEGLDKTGNAIKGLIDDIKR